MALDNANFIAELSITDPPGADPLSQGDDQIRTIKRATFQSFPLIAAAVNITDVQMNLMAIKNEANVFIGTQTIQNGNLALDDTGATPVGVVWQKSGIDQWFITQAGSTDLRFARHDIAGLFIDDWLRVNWSTGIADFAQVPTVQGAPIWIAGEIRSFVSGSTPGTNWFAADGTNGTVNLQDRWLVGAGAFAGAVGSNLNASLDALTTANSTGATALSVGQMPAHGHAVRSGSATGITDVTISGVSTETVVGGNRGNTGPSYATNNSSGNAIIQQSGSSGTHNHSSPAQDVVAQNPTFTGSVQPVSVAVNRFQYVP